MAPVLLLVIATTAFAQRQSTQPPRDLHRVGDHWTAYNPPDPATYPAEARTHTIASGDTLWDLAQRYYNNPYLWPQLWESNTWITDAHWIYPGDVLLVGGEGTAASGTTTAEGEGAMSTVTPRLTTTGESSMVEDENAFSATQTEDGIAVARMAVANNPIPLGTEADIFCYGYIGHPDEPLPNFVASHEDVEVKYLPRAKPEMSAIATIGDLVYISGGASTGLVAGETYIAVQPQDLVTHPTTGAVLGRQYDYVGQLRILCTDTMPGLSRAIVVETCREINIGARLKPMPTLPIPIARVPDLPAWCDPPSGRTSGYIVDSREWDLGLVEGVLVQIDLGSDNQIEPGDFLTVFRPSPRSDQPRMVLGEIGVLTTEARTATAVVLKARREMLIGDQVELR
ncbi:MAG TPA: LysM peptidoglycan-binding domain-containing protein [Thermoanaerobaculia bacterium]|nr:LysM peptidoglycan-binding domain-containing protein [Thermoanaerobaculia bacterium]